MREAVHVVTTFVFVASFGSAVAHEAGSCSSPPPLPNIIAQLINLYRIALSQKTAGRPLPPLSPCESAALQRAMALPDPDYASLPPPMYLQPPPFHAPPQYFPPMFAAPPPPMSNPSQAFDPSQLYLPPHLQPYPQTQMYPQVATQPQTIAQPQSVVQSQPGPQQVFSPPQTIPQPQAISPQQYSPPATADPQVNVAPPAVYYVSSGTVNRDPVYYSDHIEYARRPDVSIPTPQVVESTPKPCGCRKNAPQQVNYQYAPSVQGATPPTPCQAAARAAQYAASMGAQAAQASFVHKIPPTPRVMPPNQLVQTPKAQPQFEVVAQPAQAAPPQAYAAPQVSRESLALQPPLQYLYQSSAVAAPPFTARST